MVTGVTLEARERIVWIGLCPPAFTGQGQTNLHAARSCMGTRAMCGAHAWRVVASTPLQTQVSQPGEEAAR